MSESTSRTLLEDLEVIRSSLDKIAKSEPQIPTLEEIVGHRAPTTVNPKNPFLSSQSLSELIRIRNEAESRTAEDLANMAPVRSIDEILTESPKAPDPEQIIEQMEVMFETWIENSVSQYLQVFESELRNRLQQDFRELVSQWYRDHDLPIPESLTGQDSGSETDDSDPISD